MATKSLISVIIPNYNDSKYIGDAIKSVLNQDYSEIEVLVIDDGSTDNSLNIIHSFEDSRLKLVDRKKNMGTNYTVNEGIELAKGEYINILSANDYILPEFFQACMEQLNQHPKIGVCVCDTLRQDVTTHTNATNKFIHRAAKPIIIHVDELAKMYRNSFMKLSVGNTLIKTSEVHKYGKFNKNLYCSADWYSHQNSFYDRFDLCTKALNVWEKNF